jgi:hypothetical protein
MIMKYRINKRYFVSFIKLFVARLFIGIGLAFIAYVCAGLVIFLVYHVIKFLTI